jgi:hypothetical protein
VRERAKKLAPWIVSALLCGVLLWPFRDADGRAALSAAVGLASPWTVPVVAVLAVVCWLTDAWATGMTFRHFGTPISIKEACLVRGATLVFDAVNAGVGQVALGVVMFRRSGSLARTVQTVGVLNVVFVLQLVCASGIGLAVGYREASRLSAGVVVVSLVLAAIYLVLIAAKPAFLARRKSFGQLFEAGLRGHAVAFAVRVPSMLAIFLSAYATSRCFGMKVPFGAFLVYVPAIVLVTSAPVSVQGIGPAQLAQVAFFARFVEGADARAAEAVVVAWGLSSSVGAAIGFFLIGVACMFTEAGRAAFVAERRGETAEALAAAESPPRDEAA